MSENNGQHPNGIKSRSLAPFAPSRDDIQELATRFAFTLTYRSAEKLTHEERIKFATYCLALNMIPGLDLWYIPGIGLSIGRAGWVKKLDELADREGFRWWVQYERFAVTDYERFGVDPDLAEVAVKCSLRRSDWLATYTENLKALTDSGLTWNEGLQDVLGPPPVIVGIGVIWRYEMAGSGGKLKHDDRMSLKERAENRAFKEAARKFVPIPTGIGNGDNGVSVHVDEETIDGEAEEIPEIAAQDATNNGTDYSDQYYEETLL
jgi:hypothetical protein